MKKNEVILLFAISIATICIISYISFSHLNSLKILNESANDFSQIKEPISFLDLNDKEVMDNVFRRIKNYEAIEGFPLKHLSSFDIEDEKKLKLRDLAESNLFKDVGLINPLRDSYWYIMRWIRYKAKQFSSNIILYPYAFNYTYEYQEEGTENITNKTEEFRQGAFISLNKTELKEYNNIGLKTNGTFAAKKAKAIYDADIAILSIEYAYNYYSEDAFQDGIDWNTYFKDYYGKWTTYATYEEFLQQKKKDPSNTYVARINDTAVISGALINNGFPRFGILVIPDYKLGTDGIILSRLGKQGIQNIIDFFDKGGRIIVNGKSGTLLEDFGLMTKGMYDRTKLLSINNANRGINIKGCENTFGKKYSKEDDDFEKQTICMSISSTRNVSLATTLKSLKRDIQYSVLMELDSSNKDLILVDVEDGLTSNLTEKEKEYNPLILHRKNKKNGQIIVMNYNPVYSRGERYTILNIVALALSKDLYMNYKVNMKENSELYKDMPIPAGEFGFTVQVNILIHNLNDKYMTNSKLYVFLPDNFDWVRYPSCQRLPYNNGNDIPSNIKQFKSFENQNDYLFCDLKNLSSYQKFEKTLTITVLNSQATQSKYQILLLEAIFSYLDANSNQNTLYEQIKANCQAAPLIRGSLNPDPSSVYPLYGRGNYFDNVLKIENKEESLAYDVEYYALIPLISPIVDGDDQRKTQWSLKIYVDYYSRLHFYEVPLMSLNATDFINPIELSGKGVVMILEWDSPILPSVEMNKDGTGEKVDIPGINIGAMTINSTYEVIKQINYRKSDRFYKLASQRLMAFIDTSTPEGAKTIYNNSIPNDLLDSKFGDRAKKEFLFCRNDIYFYKNENYHYPPGVSNKTIFSLDLYKKYVKKENCVPDIGDRIVVPSEPGFFNNNGSTKYIIHKPNIYPNELYEVCGLEVYNATNETQMDEFGNKDNFKVVHFLIPNVESDITEPGQLYGFHADNKYYGYHENYTSIKFIYTHSLTYNITADQCLYGGRLIIEMGQFKLKSIDDVTVSPDQIAVYNTTYNETENKVYIYFKRGLMSNEQFGKDIRIMINIENLSSHKDETFGFTLEDMTFDISYPPTYEQYKEIYYKKDMKFNYISQFSCPALEIKASLDRELNGYETLEPFNRYGVYAQELYHRTLYSPGETHHQTDTGVQGNGNGFSFMTNLGTSSIPFLEYLKAGKGQVIPAGPSTSRVTWKDIWGRTWQQPLRTLFPDVPPIPPPLKNFYMTTTFEIIRKDTQIYEWISDEDVLIHLHIKLLNNYPKYFEITRCKENEIRYVPNSYFESYDRVYANKSTSNLSESEYNTDNMFLRQGGMASYGVCYGKEGAFVSGNEVKGQLLEQIEEARLCADSTDPNEIEKCANKLKDIKTLNKAKSDYDPEKDGIWNYSPLVENYYPKGYIEPDMWAMTHIDYYDTAMDKAYKYHVDNRLPNFDNWDYQGRENTMKPLNTISIPLYKGLGYNIEYDKSTSINYHDKKKKGWWSDNLQNKDDTLLAGQEVCNNISVDKSPIIKFVDTNELVGSKRANSYENVKKIIEKNRKNIYICLFNRKRPQYALKSHTSFFAGNVLENNVVPVFVDLNADDKRLTDFNCTGYQYSPENISLADGNYLKTPTSKDYLYFAANLRGHAKETINIVLKLKKFDKVKYEGTVKVNEGGRFVYWNPVNGPNSFLVVDDPVNVIMAKRNDLTIINNIFPSRVSTFKNTIYHSYIFRDENKINQIWPYNNFYTNSYGFGDVAITVSVGGIRKSKPVLSPGGVTYAKIIFFNNCGFDWNMKKDAIVFDYKGNKKINANDLLHNLVHAIKAPLKYNFLNFIVQKEYAAYITILPSDHNINVPPEFFDFENINVVTIRDGFKGEYNVNITVSNDFPDYLRGKPIEIKVELNSSYFDHIPGEEGDPTIPFYHNYTLKIPSIFIAVPFKGGEFDGKVLYTSAQATNLKIKFKIGIDWRMDGIKFVDKDFLEKMVNVTIDSNNRIEILKDYWEKIEKKENISYTETFNPDNTKIVTIDGINKEYPYFPMKNITGPDNAEGVILIKSSIHQIPISSSQPITDLVITYNNWINEPKTTKGQTPYIQATGPWIVLTYQKKLVDFLDEGKYVDRPNQQLFPDESGIMKVQFKLVNNGNENSYNTSYEIVIQPNLTYKGSNDGANYITQQKNSNGQTILTFNYNAPIIPGEPRGGIIYLEYKGIIDSYDLLTPEERKGLPKELPVAKESSVYMRLNQSDKDTDTVQYLRQPLAFSYTFAQKTNVFINLVISGRRSNPTVKIIPKVEFIQNETESNSQIYIGKYDDTLYSEKLRKLEEIRDDITYSCLYTKGKFIDKVLDHPNEIETENKNHNILYTVVVYGKDGSISSGKIWYKQDNVGMSSDEIILIVLSVIFFALSGLFIWRGVINLKLKNQDGDINELKRNINNPKAEKFILWKNE